MISVRATMRLRSDSLLKWREEHGYTQRQAADLCDVAISQYQKIESLDFSSPNIAVLLETIARVSEIPIADLCPDELVGQRITSRIEKAMQLSARQLAAVSESEQPLLCAENSELAEVIHRVLQLLPYREQKIIKLRFGIGCDTHTLEQVGRILKVSRERIRHIEAKALRHLQHPTRARKLEDFISPSPTAAEIPPQITGA